MIWRARYPYVFRQLVHFLGQRHVGVMTRSAAIRSFHHCRPVADRSAKKPPPTNDARDLTRWDCFYFASSSEFVGLKPSRYITKIFYFNCLLCSYVLKSWLNSESEDSSWTTLRVTGTRWRVTTLLLLLLRWCPVLAGADTMTVPTGGQTPVLITNDDLSQLSEHR